MKSVLITGASRGIGAAAAELFAENGYSVMINYNKNEQRAEQLCAMLLAKGAQAYTCQCDVTDEQQVRRMASVCEYRFGGLDVLINNAGISHFGVLGDISQGDWDKTMAVNVKGMFLTTKALLPLLRSNRGKIINVSSMWGLTGASCEVHYSASKAAVIGFTKALAKEEAPNGITVNCIAPGYIETEMNARLTEDDKMQIIEKTPLGRAGTPNDVARAMLFFASENADFITGQTLCVDGGYVI